MSKANGFAGTVSVITGASMGIGRATARQVVTRGGSVVLIARGRVALADTAGELTGLAADSEQFVETIAADATDTHEITPVLRNFVERRGAPDHLINCVGAARPGYLRDLDLEVFRDQLEVNYLGQLIPTLALLPHFAEERKGHISFVSSMMGYFGAMGYAAYAPSKFAVVGLAEALRHELKPYGVGISVLYPPDTDTPGMANENKTKPIETALMSETVGLLSAEAVAEKFVDGILKEKFSIHPKGSGWVWRLNRHTPGLVRVIMDHELKKAMRKAEQQ